MSARKTYHSPPTRPLRSNTRMLAKHASCARARTAASPDGPAPITAMLLYEGAMPCLLGCLTDES